jgi:N-acetylglucosamine-6-phosphate deacetylase
MVCEDGPVRSRTERPSTPRRFWGGLALVEGELVRADVAVSSGLISEIAIGAATPPLGEDDVDCTGLVIAPGFVDLQCNGASGIDITSDPERILDVAAQLPRFGVTSFLPTVVTAPAATRAAAIAAMPSLATTTDAFVDGRVPATPLGLHFEGPMISRHHLGAHRARFAARPDELLDEVAGWAASDVVSLVTLAPELTGALEVVERLVAGGVVVSAGHTAMTPAEFRAARAAGVSWVTHLFNAMAPFGHRAPGPVGAVLADPTVTVGMICDGIHVDAVAVAMAWRSLGPHRTALVSDASPALGAAHGQFEIGGAEVIHDDTGVRTRDGILAGSALELDRAVRNLMAFTDCSLADALTTVTTTPAGLLALDDRGCIRVGARADLAILDPAGHLRRTVIGGATAWQHD